MTVALDTLRTGTKFVIADGSADGHEGEPETVLVLADPVVNGFACRVQVRSETDGFEFVHAGNPADRVVLA